jgi:hypothetical protein
MVDFKQKRRQVYEVKKDVYFKSKVNDMNYVGDLLNEEDIEGKKYYVVRKSGRIIKLAKEFYTISKR